MGLAEAVRNARLPAGTRVLVVVDQFEEIFRFRRMADPEEAAAFVKLLLQAAADPDAFWVGQARQLEWITPFTKGLEWNAPFATWFADGQLNVDPHRRGVRPQGDRRLHVHD